MLGTGCGVLVGLLTSMAVLLDSFWLYCLDAFFGGAYMAVTATSRFAAADCAPEDEHELRRGDDEEGQAEPAVAPGGSGLARLHGRHGRTPGGGGMRAPG